MKLGRNKSVRMEEGHSWPYSLSVYFVGVPDGNCHAIRVMDATSLNVVALTSLINDYRNGFWCILSLIQFHPAQIMDITGIHMSAVTFWSRKDNDVSLALG